MREKLLSNVQRKQERQPECETVKDNSDGVAPLGRHETLHSGLRWFSLAGGRNTPEVAVPITGLRPILAVCAVTMAPISILHCVQYCSTLRNACGQPARRTNRHEETHFTKPFEILPMAEH